MFIQTSKFKMKLIPCLISENKLYFEIWITMKQKEEEWMNGYQHRLNHQEQVPVWRMMMKECFGYCQWEVSASQ